MDITEREQLQAQIVEAQKLDAIGTLAGGIAHLFNNALVSITGYTGLLEMSFPGNKELAEYTSQMKQSAHQMAHWTSQLLAYARGGKYEPEIISLRDLVEDTFPLIRPGLNQSIHLETDLPIGLKNVKADRSQMQMVLTAIMSNSNDAIEGEGRIRVLAKNLEISEGHSELSPGAYVCLSVEDDGKGMDETTRSRVFDPFLQPISWAGGWAWQLFTGL